MDNPIQKIGPWLGAGSIDIFGLPFAGKDTQGQRLAELLGGVMVSSGAILRSYRDQTQLQQIMASGDLIPSDLLLQIMTPYFARPELEQKPLILSSVGKWHGEEQGIMEATAAAGHPLKAVVFLQLSEDEVWCRHNLSRAEQDRGKRADDSDEALKTRLKVFHAKTQPVIDFYRSQNLLIEVDGSLTPGEVTDQILDGLVGFTK